MSIIKIAKDYIIKAILGKNIVPRELLDLHDYFRLNGPINFTYEKRDGLIIAESTNFRFGSIITSGINEKELDANIKDAIITSFDLPSAYSAEAKIQKEGQLNNSYALA
jgi:hypothetical protein